MLLYESQKSPIHALAFSPDGMLLASGAEEGGVMLHSLDGSATTVGDGQNGRVYGLAFHPDEEILAQCGEFGWSCSRQNERGRWVPYGASMTIPTMAIAYLDRETLALGIGSRLHVSPGRFELWDLRTGRKIDPFFNEPQGVRAVTVCPRRKIVAWAAGQRSVSVWDTRKQDPTVKFAPPGQYLAIAINRDASILAVSSGWVVHVYDLEKKSEMHILKVHKGRVEALAFSPDGCTLATGSWDRTVRLWNAATGREQAVYEWPIGGVSSLAYSPDGARLAAGGDSGAVVVWDLE